MAKYEVALSFHDCLLYTHDVKRLQVDCWLNDSIIEFAFEYFTQVLFSNSTSQPFLFLSPSTTQLLKLMGPSEASLFLDPLNFNSKSVTFLPVNDNDDPDVAGGNHWSLLVLNHESGRAFHLDSMGSSNRADAVSLTTTLSSYCKRPIKPVDIDCPKQENACDCGAYVIHFARLIAEYIVGGGRCESREIELAVSSVTPSQVTNVREELRKWITNLADDSSKAT